MKTQTQNKILEEQLPPLIAILTFAVPILRSLFTGFHEGLTGIPPNLDSMKEGGIFGFIGGTYFGSQMNSGRKIDNILEMGGTGTLCGLTANLGTYAVGRFIGDYSRRFM